MEVVAGEAYCRPLPFTRRALEDKAAVAGAGGNITDSDDEADAVDAEGVPLFMWQALGDFGAAQPQAPHGPGVEVQEAPGDPQ